MACKFNTLEGEPSKLYTELESRYNEAIADKIYGKIHSKKFKKEFGNWELAHNLKLIKKLHAKELKDYKDKKEATLISNKLNKKYGEGSTKVGTAAGGVYKIRFNTPKNVSVAVNSQGEPQLFYHLDDILSFTSNYKEAGNFEDLDYEGSIPLPSKGEVRPVFLKAKNKDGDKVKIESTSQIIQIVDYNMSHKTGKVTQTDADIEAERLKKEIENLSKKEIRKRKELSRKLVGILQTKVELYERKGNQGVVEKNRKVIKSLQADIKNEKYMDAILSFIEHAKIAAKKTSGIKIKQIVNDFNRPGATYSDKKEALKKLETAADFLSSFSIVKELFKELDEQVFEKDGEAGRFDYAFATENLDPVISAIQKTEDEYIKYGRELLVDFVEQYNNNPHITREDIKEMLVQMTDDVSKLNADIQAIADSKDQILEVIAVAISSKKMNVHKQSEKWKQSTARPALEKLLEHQRKNGISLTNNEKLYDFMLQRDDKGELIGKYKDPTKEGVKESMTPEQFEFLEFYHNEYTKAQRRLNPQFRNGLFIPTKLKSTFERGVENVKGIKSGAQSIKQIAKETFTIQADDTDFINIATDESGKEHQFLPIKFTQSIGGKKGIPVEHISLDLISSLSMFNTMSLNYSQMNSILTEVEAAKSVIAERDVAIKKKGKIGVSTISGAKKEYVTKKGIETNAYRMLEDYVNRVFYGEYKADSGDIAGLNLGKTADAINSYSAVAQLSLNLYSAINNRMVGGVMNMIEASGGQFYTPKDLKEATKVYWKNINGFVKDSTAQFSDNMINQWMEQNDIFQEFDDNGHPIDNHIKAQRILSRASSFLQKGGEHMIQTKMAIAMAHSHKIINGKILSYQDWMIQENKPNNKESKKQFETYPTVFSTLTQKNNTISSSAKLNEREMQKFTERIKGVYRYNHGNYSKITQAAIQKEWYGRLLVFFRRWMKSGWDRRMAPVTFNGKDTFNQQLGANMAGNYKVAAQFLKELKDDLGFIGVFTSMTNGKGKSKFDQLPEWKKSAMRKTLTEIATFTAMLIIISALGESEDDDDWVTSMVIYQAHRLKGEIAFYVNPIEAMKILRTPAASMNTVEKLGKTLYYLAEPVWTAESWSEYERGKRKGQTRVGRYAWELVPYGNQISRWTSPEEYAKMMSKTW